MKTKQQIQYLSQPEAVSMGDAWFELATIDHFWIKRRFSVMQKLAPFLTDKNLVVGEIGSGSGTVQRQFELEYGRTVDGFDLNEYALMQSISETSNTYCYNIHDRAEAFKEKYDVIVLFDVIEHIDDVPAFMESVLFHLKPGGRVMINVPALMALMSKYDVAAGHVKRYVASDFRTLGTQLSLHTVAWSYWGMPYIPLLFLRKLMLSGKTDKDAILKSGFGKKSGLVNSLLGLLGAVAGPRHYSGPFVWA